MKNDWTITQEAFDNLLAWLDEDRERAGRKYEEIRSNLIRVFARRGCPVAEELTDETINRVTRKALDIAQTYVGDPALYFYGVAQNVYKEYVKKQPDPLPLPQSDPIEEKEPYFDCLDRCMERLDPQSRNLIIEYHSDERRAKIDRRQALAERLGITLITLRTRTHRIKLTLQRCMSDCLMQHQLPGKM